jgi:hypothetical protein
MGSLWLPMASFVRLWSPMAANNHLVPHMTAFHPHMRPQYACIILAHSDPFLWPPLALFGPRCVALIGCYLSWLALICLLYLCKDLFESELPKQPRLTVLGPWPCMALVFLDVANRNCHTFIPHNLRKLDLTKLNFCSYAHMLGIYWVKL